MDHHFIVLPERSRKHAPQPVIPEIMLIRFVAPGNNVVTRTRYFADFPVRRRLGGAGGIRRPVPAGRRSTGNSAAFRHAIIRRRTV
jgi:hypothetical protein